MKDIGLVVEGGGMRGVYTAGVLDFFMEKNLNETARIGKKPKNVDGRLM